LLKLPFCPVRPEISRELPFPEPMPPEKGNYWITSGFVRLYMREQTPAWQVQCSGIFFYSTTCIYAWRETRPVHRSVYAETVSLIGRSLVFEKILLATDFSAYAEKTLECIAGFPEAREVILFHVAEEAISPIAGERLATLS
jgi:hypothetical protein